MSKSFEGRFILETLNGEAVTYSNALENRNSPQFQKYRDAVYDSVSDSSILTLTFLSVALLFFLELSICS